MEAISIALVSSKADLTDLGSSRFVHKTISFENALEVSRANRAQPFHHAAKHGGSTGQATDLVV